MWLVKLALGLALIYVAVAAIVYAAQTRLIFPAGMAGGAPTLPASAEKLELETPDGTRLAGVHLPPAEAATDAPPSALLLGFGGNAWNAEAMALYLHDMYPGHPVATFHYRGYRPSAGQPGAEAILDDALLVHDYVKDRLEPQGVVVVGFSLGGGPAARIAAERDIAGAILVTPFDSLEALASHYYPWLPVRLLLRHRMEVAEMLARSEAPTAILTAEHDTIVPAARSAPVAHAARHLVFERAVAGAEHNDLYGHPDFVAAMRAALRGIDTGADDAGT